jgi:hypothetical protein
MEGARQRGEPPVCECGRDELDKLETEINKANKALGGTER